MTLDLFIFLPLILDIISVFKGSNAPIEMTGGRAAEQGQKGRFLDFALRASLEMTRSETPSCHLDQAARGEICHVSLYAQLQRNNQILFIFVPSECQ